MWRTLTALLVSVLIGQCTELYAYVENTGQWSDSSGAGVTEEDGSGNENENELGSADDGDKTQCERWRDAPWTQPGEYQPKCTETGDFAPLQCHANTRECWCVHPDGQEITGTRISRGHKPVCPPDRGPLDGGDDIYISDTTTPRDIHRKHTSTVAPDDDKETDVQKLPSSDLRTFIREQPLFLAALIGGAVLILLLIILILMFIVYRMRKKDEGSYSLDEPRHSFSYTRAKDQEFFA